MATPYTYKSLSQRIKRHIANGFPNSSFSITDNELYLMIEQAVAFNLVGQSFNNAKIEGNLSVPEGYQTTFLLPALQQDTVTHEWYSTLPQVPVSLPLGYSVDDAYFADSAYGKGVGIALIKGKRENYRRDLPQSPYPKARIEGAKIIVETTDGSSLFGKNLYVRMASTKIQDANGDMAIPTDAIELVWNLIIPKILQRLGIPKDVVADDLPQGKTNVSP